MYLSAFLLSERHFYKLFFQNASIAIADNSQNRLLSRHNPDNSRFSLSRSLIGGKSGMTVEQTKLLERVRQTVKSRHLSSKTENAYVNHIRNFLEFHGESSDLLNGRVDKIRAFLGHLRHDARSAASTYNQARCALLFLYRDVFGHELPMHFDQIKRARPKEKFLVTFTPEEVSAILSHLHDASYLIAALIYGSGLRLAETVALRVRDIDFKQCEIVVRCPRTGARDRTTVLPKAIIKRLERHLVRVKFIYEDDCLSGFGRIFLPEKVFRRTPEAAYDWNWHYVFPAGKMSHNKNGGISWRHHTAESTVQKAVAEAIEKARIFKHGCCQTLRYSFAARLFEKNYSVHTIQNLLGHKNLKTTMSYLNTTATDTVLSPLDI
jgi:integron integrase